MLFNSLEKKFAPKLKIVTRYESLFRGCSFSVLSDRSFVCCNSEELGGFLQEKLGEDTGSVSITYYKAGELCIECYLSRRNALQKQYTLRAALSGLDESNFSRIDYSAYEPGSTDACFALWMDGVNEHNFDSCVSILVESVHDVLRQI